MTVPSQVNKILHITTDIDLYIDNNQIIVESIQIDDNEQLHQSIQNIIQDSKRSLAQIYQFISDNIDIYQTQNTDICDQIEEYLKNGKVESCTLNNALIAKAIDNKTQRNYGFKRDKQFKLGTIQVDNP